MAKREYGYVVDMRVFVRVDPKDLDDTVKKAEAIRAAQSSNDISGLVGSDVIAIKQRYTSRQAAEAETVHEPTQSVAEIAGQATGGVVEGAATDPADPQETGPGSVGQDQMDATEEAASTEPAKRRR